VHSANAEARREGVRTGQAVSTALARVPALQLIAHDPEREADSLERLALWAWQFSSQLSIAPPTALLLEIGASLTLLGPLQQVLDTLHAELDTLGYRHRCGVAPTPLAARLMARQGLAPALDTRQLDTALHTRTLRSDARAAARDRQHRRPDLSAQAPDRDPRRSAGQPSSTPAGPRVNGATPSNTCRHAWAKPRSTSSMSSTITAPSAPGARTCTTRPASPPTAQAGRCALSGWSIHPSPCHAA